MTTGQRPAASPERLARLAGATAETGVGVCFGIAERAPGGEPYITQVFAAAGQVGPFGGRPWG